MLQYFDYSSLEIHIPPDAMEACITVNPEVGDSAGQNQNMPTAGNIEAFMRGLLKDNGVVFGINDDDLKGFVTQILYGLNVKTTIKVAEGAPAIKGDDGRVEFCFNTDSSPTPTVNPDGSADYKNINMVHPIEAGTVLAKLLPPSKGTPGRDILGRVINALDGNPAALPVGANTAIPKGSPFTLIATADGIPRFDGTAVNISEGYSISGNVDYSTGNISYENSVAIGGDVKSGFDVTCGGDLQVNGIIEDCQIVVGGNVLCRYGFVGSGKGIIIAKGDVNVVYAKNQTIVSDGNVNIAKESINSNISARKSINIYGHRLSAAGGTLASTGAIVIKTVGNISGVQTTLQIDHDHHLIDERDKTKAIIEQHNGNIKKLTQTLNTLPPSKKLDHELMRKLKSTIITLSQQITEQENKLRELHILMAKFENSFIRIDRLAYPGTIIKFGTKQLALTEMLAGGKTIRIVNGEIATI